MPFIAFTATKRIALASGCMVIAPSSCCSSSELIHFKPSFPCFMNPSLAVKIFVAMLTSEQSSTCLASASSLAIMAFALYLEVSEHIAFTTTVAIEKAFKPSTTVMAAS